MQFVCTKKCFHGSKLYRVGDYAKFASAEDGPKNHEGGLIHFEPIDSDQPFVRRSHTTVKVNNKDV